MTFLEMCVRLRDEAGIPGTGPASTIAQSGDYLRIVNWIQAANQDIQNHRPDWRFMLTDFSFSTVDGTQSYSPTDVSITDLQQWKVSMFGDIRAYTTTSNEQYLDFLPWDLFKQTYLFGTSRDQEGKPIVVTIKPDNSIVFHPTPDDEYTIVGEYYKKAVELSGNTDEPIYPSQFHLAAVWRGLTFYGAYDAADERYSHGQNEYKKLIKKMEFDQIEQCSWGAPLA